MRAVCGLAHAHRVCRIDESIIHRLPVASVPNLVSSTLLLLQENDCRYCVEGKMDTSRIARDHFFYVCFRVGEGFEERQMEISFFHRDDEDDFDTCFISCLR